MLKKVQNVMVRISKPLLAIEFTVYVAVILYAIVAVAGRHEPQNSVGNQPPIVQEYALISTILVFMAINAIAGIVALSNRSRRWSTGVRTGVLLILSIGLTFIEAMVIFNIGFESFRWINQLALLCITVILYLNVKVFDSNADK